MAKKVGWVVAIGLHGARALVRNAVRYRPRIWFVQGRPPFYSRFYNRFRSNFSRILAFCSNSALILRAR